MEDKDRKTFFELSKLRPNTHVNFIELNPQTKPLKETKPMSDLSSTILALQIMNGLRIYECSVIGIDRSMFLFKSNVEHDVGTPVLLQMKQTYVAGYVIGEVTGYDYDSLGDANWIISQIPDPAPIIDSIKDMDVKAKQKLQQAKAIQAAKQLLEASGLAEADLKALFAPK